MTADGMPTTAGSAMLSDYRSSRMEGSSRLSLTHGGGGKY